MRPFTLLIKPAGPDCNIACNYCFYACKKDLFEKGAHRMSEQVLDTLVKSYLSLNFPASAFAWQGGEPTLMGLDFYKKLVELQQKYGSDGQMVTNSLQTNGILLDDDWCRFLAEYKFLVGISLDGPEKYHDHYRKDRADKGTFDKVLSAIEKCRKHNVQFNILVLLNDRNVNHPDELFDFFTARKVKYLQFIPCVEKDTSGQIAPYSITADQYGAFLCRIFDCWFDYGPEKLSVRIFDSVLSHCLGAGNTECTFGPQCNDYIVIEHNGDAFCCDFFVEEKFHLGNIFQTPVGDLAASEKKRFFSRQKRDLDNSCLICRHLDFCRGGCPKDRIITGSGYKHPSYFCGAYKKFFDHGLPRFWNIAANLRQQNSAKTQS